MNLKKALLMSLVAGCACGVAAAQDDFPATLPMRVANEAPYSSRALGFVYDNVSNSFGSAGGTLIVLGTTNMVDDINLAPGPWAALTNQVPTQFSHNVQVSGFNTAAGAPANVDFDIIFDFYDTSGIGFFNNADMLAGAPLIGSFRQVITGVAQGFIWQYTLGLTGITLPNSDFALQVRYVQTGTTTRLFHASGAALGQVANPAGWDPSGTPAQHVFPVFATCPVSPGSSTIGYGRDINGDGIFAGGATIIAGAGAGAHEYRCVSTAATAQSYCFRMQGDIVVQPPANIDLGCVTDGSATTVGSIADNTAQWYRMELCAGASAEDCLDKFLDIDTDGSATDVAIALYNDGGAVIASRNGGGPNGSDFMSYGIGRRDGGTGENFDGRDGQLATGVYYLAVAPGASGFGAGFTVNASGLGGSYNLNRRSNAVAGGAFTLVTPKINSEDFDALLNLVDGVSTGPVVFGPDPSDQRGGTGRAVGLKGVLWNKFTLANDVTAAQGNYVNFEFGRNATPTADGVAYVFNSNGDIVAYSDDEGEAALPMLSFGDNTVGRQYSTPNFPTPTVTYQGANGDLLAGTYYVAYALWATNDADVCALTNDRFHVRGTSGSNLTMGADLFAGGPAGGGGCTVTCDYNDDGGGDNADVTDLANAIASDTDPFPNHCKDFNQDGGADNSDVTDMADAIAGGTCP